MQKEIIFATGNVHKARETGEILGIPVKQVDLEIDEIQSLDSDEVAIKKAEAAYQKLKNPLIAEDGSFSVEAWNGLPGALITWFTGKTIGVDGFLKLLEKEPNRNAEVKISIAYCDEKGSKVFSSVTKGQTTKKQRGDNGWEWDRIFQPDGFDKTYAEMTSEEKNKVSTRKEVLEKLKEFLNEKS